MSLDDEKNAGRKLESSEYGGMRFEGDVSVFSALKEAVEAVRRGETPKARIGLIIGPGAMRGVVGGGCDNALHDLNLTDGFAVVVGSSAGAPVGA